MLIVATRRVHDSFLVLFTGIIAFFCSCYTFGKNAEQLGESCVMYALSQFVPLLNLWCRTQVRGRIREQKSIKGTSLEDLLMVYFCAPCSLVQEAMVSNIFTLCM